MFLQPASICRLCSAFRQDLYDGLCVGCWRKTCDHTGEIVAVRKVNGTLDLHERCCHCHLRLRGVKQSAVADVSAIPVVRDHTGKNPPCVRCGDPHTELHHFAPRALFGLEEAEQWPTAYLCVRCHTTWHRVMARGRSAAA